MGATTRSQRQGSEPEAREALATRRANHRNRPGERSGVRPEGKEGQPMRAAKDAQDGAESTQRVQQQQMRHVRVQHVTLSWQGTHGCPALACTPWWHTPLSWPQGRCPLTSCTVPQLSLLGPLLHLHSLPHPVCDPIQSVASDLFIYWCFSNSQLQSRLRPTLWVPNPRSPASSDFTYITHRHHAQDCSQSLTCHPQH